MLEEEESSRNFTAPTPCLNFVLEVDLKNYECLNLSDFIAPAKLYQ
jgi:hypothetical protein